jgi:hypothetical protein
LVGCGVDGGLSTSSPSLLAAAELEFAAMTSLFLAREHYAPCGIYGSFDAEYYREIY